MKANATVRHQGISLTDAFITNISTVTYYNTGTRPMRNIQIVINWIL